MAALLEHELISARFYQYFRPPTAPLPLSSGAAGGRRRVPGVVVSSLHAGTERALYLEFCHSFAGALAIFRGGPAAGWDLKSSSAHGPRVINNLWA